MVDTGSGRSRTPVDGDALRVFREEYPLTVRELAEMSGVSLATISGIENKHRSARPSTVRKLASALDVEPGDLLTRTAS